MKKHKLAIIQSLVRLVLVIAVFLVCDAHGLVTHDFVMGFVVSIGLSLLSALLDMVVRGLVNAASQ